MRNVNATSSSSDGAIDLEKQEHLQTVHSKIPDDLAIEIKKEERQLQKEEVSQVTREVKDTQNGFLGSLPPEEDPFYNRFSSRRKSLFIVIVAYSVFLAPASSMAFLPAISYIADEFNTTSTIINVSTACYFVVMAISPCVMTPLGDIYGRRPLYIICSIGFTIMTILVAFSQNLAMYFVFRSLSALFGTAFFALGGGIMGDIFIPQERGNAMGWTLSGSQFGPVLGPICGGIIITYTSDWRIIFYVLAGLGGLMSILSILFIKETIRKSKHQIAKEQTGKKFVFVKYHPFTVIKAFSYSNLILCAFMSMSLIYSMNTITTTIPNVIDPRFNLTKPVYGALFYLPLGVGYLVGSLFGGKWADVYVRRYMKLRGKRVPEDRLRSTYISFGVALPVSVLIYGWALQKEKGGMALPIIALFCNGVAQTFCFPSINAYAVDCLPQLGGDAIASNYCARYIAGAVGSATCLIQVENIGVGWTNTISFFVLEFGFTSCFILIKYGDKLGAKAGRTK